MVTTKPKTVFTHQALYPCTPDELYQWHSRAGALERLLPPWEKSRVIEKRGGIKPGGMVRLKMHAGPLPFFFTARHTQDIPGVMFQDIQEKGPFRSWSHTHYFDDNPAGTILRDLVEYELPGDRFLPGFVKNHVTKSLEALFHHRKSLLTADISLHKRCSTRPLRILLSGASGVLGRELIPLLTTGGHEVWRLVRRRPDSKSREIFWDPENNLLDPDQLPDLDGVIHLAGEYIGLSRWSEEKKRRVIDSRIKGTDLLTRRLAGMARPPRVFLSASAVGYYGDCGDRLVAEEAPAGTDFISRVCSLWEAAAEPLRTAGIRTVFLRLGVGLTPRGGALERILTTSPVGFIRRFGSGQQYISWISSDDMISAMLHALSCEEIEGPLNISAPEPVTNAQFMQTLSKVAGRPLLFPVPARVLQIVYGQMASEILLSGCRVSTRKLQDSGFIFRHPTLESALSALLGRQ
ncbi:MAG: TIGR01777 family oxidoreductase [Desulforhopalus sp.]